MSAPVPREVRRPVLRPAALEWIAGVVAVVGVALLLAPVSARPAGASASARAGGAVSPPRLAPPLAADSTDAIIVATNLFSGSRRAPRERFRAPGLDLDPMPAPPMAGGTPAPTTSGGDGALAGGTGPQLLGIVRIGEPPQALLQFGTDTPPRLLRVGERAAGWRVLRILADRVDLVSSSGQRTVRLTRRPPSDSVPPPS